MINAAALALIIEIIFACEKWRKRLVDHDDFLQSKSAFGNRKLLLEDDRITVAKVFHESSGNY